jgi:hypothetical protein
METGTAAGRMLRHREIAERIRAGLASRGIS